MPQQLHLAFKALIFLALSSLLIVQVQATERVFTCRDWLEHDWPRTLLHYDIAAKPGEFVPGQTALTDADGTPVEHQVVAVETHPDGSISKGRVSFYAALAKGESWSYTFAPAQQPATFPPRVTAARRGEAIEVVSPEAGVRLPPPGEKRFDPPVEPKDAPPPLLGWRLADGRWVGKAWLESDRKVTGWSQRVVADGPLYKEYAYEVRFAPGAPPRDTPGYYRVRVRVEAEQPLVHVAEEYDFGCATAGKDAFVLALNDGLQADTVLRSAYGQPPGSEPAHSDAPGMESDMRAWRERLAFGEEREHTGLYPSHDWGQNAQYYGLYAEGGERAPFVGLVTQHTGAWRLSEASPIRWTRDGRVLVRFRTSVDLHGEPRGPFSTGEIDPDLPQSLGRRMWALALGTRPENTADGKADASTMRGYRCYQGFLTLDDYKEWRLTWEEQPLPRPRVLATPASIERLKANLDRCPGKEQIKNFSLLTGNAERALADAAQADRALDGAFRLLGRIFYSHYRQTQDDYQLVWLAESALANPAVTGELRDHIRAKLAARCYLLSHANFNPSGAAVHMGTPNMAINRYMGLPLYAQLIADHPKAKEWLDDAYAYTKWKTSYNVTSGGGTFRENPGYATYGPTIFLSTAAIALRHAGYDIDAFKPLKDIGRYFRDIDTPVVPPMGIANMNRHGQPEALAGRSVRTLPAFGHGRNIAGGQTRMLLANLTAARDPEFAAELMGAFGEAGAYLGTEMDQPFMWLYWNGDIQPRRPLRQDRPIAGFGGVLRAHYPHADETCVILRNGYTQSHWHPDQGTLAFYSRGVCISPPTGWGYANMEAGLCRDSRVSFGVKAGDPEHGRVDTNIEDYGSLPSLGYMLGRQTFKRRWDKTGTLQNDFDWSRQTLLVKSAMPTGATYLVVRDSTQGRSPLARWWHHWFAAPANRVAPIAGGVRVGGIQKSDVRVDVVFAEPAGARVAVQAPAKAPDGYEGWDFVQLTVTNVPEQGFLTVFYPSKGDEPALGKVEPMGEGVVRITTAESEDTVFAGVDAPVVWKRDGFAVNAHAGAIRVFPDRVVLINAAGRYGTLRYRNAEVSGLGPFEYTVDVAGTAATPVVPARTVAAVAPPPGGGTLIAIAGGERHPHPDVTVDGLAGWIRIDGDTVTYAMAEGFGQIGYRDFFIRGEAPFTVVHAPGRITLTAEGRRRVFQMPIPENLVPARLLPPRDSLPEAVAKRMLQGWVNWPWAPNVVVDGVGGVQAGWYDGKMTVGLDDGAHTAVITPYTNPSVWDSNAYTRMLP